MRRTVVETYVGREEWRCEFKDRAEGQRFVGWARAAGKLGPVVGDMENERREEALFVAALRDWMAANGRTWIDLPDNEERVDEALARRLAERGQSVEASVRKGIVRTWRWKDRRLRRQSLGEPDLAYAANTIAKRIAAREETKSDSAQAPGFVPDATPDEARDLGAEILACLREDRWRARTYNEVANAVGTDWRSALIALRSLVAGGSGVVTVGEGKNAKYRYTPEALKWTRNGKGEGRVRQVATLALAVIEHHVGISKRGVRELVRESLGTCSSPTIDAALRALVGSGLVMVQGGGAGMASRYFVRYFEEDDRQAKATALSFLCDECAYEERALRSARLGIPRTDGGLKEQARRDVA